MPEQNFQPRIHVTEADFAVLTEHGRLCAKGDGHMQIGDFEEAMRRQMRFYAQRKLSDCLAFEELTEAQIAQVGHVTTTVDTPPRV